MLTNHCILSVVTPSLLGTCAVSEEVQKLLERLIETEVGSEIKSGRPLISDMIQFVEDKGAIVETLDNYRRKRQELNNSKLENSSGKDNLINNLKNFKTEKIRKLAGRLDDTEKQLKDLRDKIAPKRENMRQLEIKLNEINAEVDEETKKSLKAKRWNDRREFIIESKNILTALREEILDEIRNRVEEGTNKIFKKLISRRWQLEKVEISPDYKIRVLDKEGVDNLRTLSAGQTLYLSLSFIAAIHEVTAINYPMVIDSPFGKVSGLERVWAAEDLSDFLPNTQITFLVTDTEYSSDVYNMLNHEKIPSIRRILIKNKKVWKEFNLIMIPEDEKSLRTEINPVETEEVKIQ